MHLTQLVAGAIVGSTLGLAAVAFGAAVASADPAITPSIDLPALQGPLPLKPNHDDEWYGDDRGRRGHDDGGGYPWGWGPPPPVRWNGPGPFQYYNYWVTPVFDDYRHAWGFWIPGFWVPLI
ncbi:MAG: hypothetical protein JWR37_5528 [Mycobacterium sp.]|jgi:hypothetical protein|nr:hypothetical protein [Mycobacterium sp.]